MHYRVYYLFDRFGESVSSASAVEMSARSICDQLLPRLQSEDDFLGIIDPAETILQILCEREPDRYWVELPMEAAKASYGTYMNLEELRAFVAQMPALPRRQPPGSMARRSRPAGWCRTRHAQRNCVQAWMISGWTHAPFP